ncbi:hypothetical protein BCV69DRAFT_119029 [Microstroma glucosiphilum]|uniref:Uncharacterized protein n=1 Tax=Pseudomicrostroma glucosiphilum TaxID=1684307 RepID=A0A316UJM7_9BASI|nr:hypothetical protein BCV69DRAFT_119029 [Pseudomicrostroma glucosiphilum]PWN23425.1 hypothetical protein BCV69DRAFT_119029 [Pseudomicrostroma glucosiphilum]
MQAQAGAAEGGAKVNMDASVTPSSPNATALHPGAHLPVELVLRILLTAATEDQATAHALAHVSRAVCRATAAHRWRCIVIDSFSALLKLWATVLEARGRSEDDLLAVTIRLLVAGEAANEAESMQRHLNQKPNLRAVSLPFHSEPDEPPDRTGLSTCHPGLSVQSFFMDTEPPTLGKKAPLSFDNFGEKMSQLCERVIPLLSPLADDTWSTRQQRRLALDRPDVKLGSLLRLFPNVDIVSLGASEYCYLSPSLHSVSPSELSIVYQGNTTSLEEDFTFSTSAFSREEGRVELAGVRKRLKRLHIVATDPQSEAAGVEPPFSLLEPLRAGSTSPGSLIDAQARYVVVGGSNESGQPAADRQSVGLIQLRYDTRRFALRPASIVAGRLRHFLQELTLSRTSSSFIEAPTQSSFSYTGRPFAAPPRGAGNQSSLGVSAQASPLSIFDDETSEAAMLREWGVGAFAKLQLSWSDRNAPRAEDLPWWRRARYSAIEKSEGANSSGADKQALNHPLVSGGWPRETRDVWTERSDRDQSATFEGELADCVWSLFGWKPAGGSSASAAILNSNGSNGTTARTQSAHAGPVAHRYLFAPIGQGEMGERIPSGYLEADRSALATVAAGLASCCASPVAALPASSSENDGGSHGGGEGGTRLLSYAVRAPATVLRFGGAAAFDKETRLAYFLDRVAGGKGPW